MPDHPIFSVSEFIQVIKQHLTLLGSVVVEGEITGYRVSKERLVYFELKDAKSRVLCFMLVGDADVELSDGMSVRVTAIPSLFQGSGGFHLRVQQVELVGQGALQQALRLLQAKLDAEGLFAEGRKRSLPQYPERIGIITSVDAAAYTDVLRILRTRWPQATVVHFPVGVQGTGAVSSIVGALQHCHISDVDVVILTRGGGSLEDLQAFNSEKVARAIFSCRVPVVCGVGHERDWTIADLVADVRASTPTNAAERATPLATQVLADVQTMERQMEDGWRMVLGDLHDRLHHLTRDLSDVVQGTVQRIRLLQQTCVQAFSSGVEHMHTRLANATKLVQTLSPAATLDRGYSLTTIDGKVVTNADTVKPGQRLHTRVKRGTIRSTVTS